MSKLRQSTGFTIVELLIATTIFSVILILCTTALLQVSRMYYKGVTISQTQEVTRAIINSVSNQAQYSSGRAVRTIAPLLNKAPDGVTRGICIDHYRYSYIPYHTLSDNPNDHGLVMDDLNDLHITCSPTVLPQSLASFAPVTPSSREFLKPNMQVSAPIFVGYASRTDFVYIFVVSVAYGDNDLFIDKTPDGVIDDGDTPLQCKTEAGTQFCTTTSMSVFVQKRLQ